MAQTNPPNHITIESLSIDDLPVIKKSSRLRSANREIYVSISVDNHKPKSTNHYPGGGAMLEEKSMPLYVVRIPHQG
jgi:hypothetical protein